MTDYYPSYLNFTPSEIDAIKDLVAIAIKQKTPINQMFPGNSKLVEMASLLYLTMKGAKFVFGAKPQEKDRRDKELGALPETNLTEIDLRNFCSPVEHQGSLGSCTANAAVGALELLERKTTNTFIDRSRLFIYYNTREMEGTANKDSGATIRDTVKSLHKYGVCRESIWPYNISKFKIKPNEACYQEASTYHITQYVAPKQNNINDVRNLLSLGYPVIFAMYIYPEFESEYIMRTGVLPMPTKDEHSDGGHALLIVGFNDKEKQLIVRNSWGPFWGKYGYFYMPYEYYEQYTFDPWTISLGD